MTTTHTQCRLKVQHPHSGPRGFELADEKTGMNQVCQDVTEANARRLAACWNACQGMSTEKIEELDSIGGTPALIVYGDDMRCERNELLAALRECIAAADNSANPGADDVAAMLRFADADKAARLLLLKFAQIQHTN